MTTALGAKPVVDTSEYKARLREMNADLRVLESGFRASTASMGNWAQSGTGLEARIKSLNAQMEVQRQKVALLKNEYERVKREKGEDAEATKRAEIEYNKSVETLGKMEHELGETEVALDEMGQETDQAGKSVDELGDESEKSGRKLEGMKTILVGLGAAAKAAALAVVAALTAIAAAAGAIGVAMWNSANTIDAAYDTIIVKTGATGSELETLKDDFDAVFQSVPVDAETASTAIAELNVRLGLSGDALREVAVPLLEMTRMLGGDVQQNAALFGRVIGDWGVPTEHSAQLLDQLFVASQQTGVGVDSLMQKIVQFGSPMRLMGFSIEEAIGLFAKWEQEGVNAELVMGSLRIAAGHFARENIELADGLWDTVDAIKNAASESDALALGMEVFGARAGPDMVAAIREGRFEVEDLIAALGEADGAILSTADATEDWGEKLQKFKNQAMVALAPAGMQLMDIASSVMDTLAAIFANPAVQAGIEQVAELFALLAGVIEDADGDLGKMSEGLVSFVGRLAGMLGDAAPQLLEVGLSVVLSILQGITKALPQLLQAATKIINGLVTFLVAALPELIQAAVPILLTLVEAIVENLPMLVDAALKAIVALADGLSKAAPELVPAILEAVNLIVQTLVSNAPALLRAAGELIVALARGLANFAQAHLNPAAIQAIESFLAGLALGAIRLVQAGIQIVANVRTGIANSIAALSEFGRLVSDTVSKAVRNITRFLQSIGRSIVQGVWQGIQAAASWFYNLIYGFFSNMVDSVLAALGISSPSRVFAEIGKQTVRGFALGFEREFREVESQMARAFGGLGAAFGMPPREAGWGASANQTAIGPFYAPVVIQGPQTPGSLGAAIKGKRF